ncbi:1833_t:CDS:2 [Gigaspora margarita]|uniref:1833_t:CDS:1 n=1 Tax=Gigaspora margarita TaxID=4874 RepID=A0ABN7UG09_GIGMA|nr:1833_t:CDS:2 [Gigaspora margarita]
MLIRALIPEQDEAELIQDKGYNEQPSIRNYYEAKVKKIK